MNNVVKLILYKLIVLSFLIFGHSFSFAANNLRFNHLTVIDGLLHNSATCITQDSIGYIWIGTQRGLNRYDGYKLDSYLYDSDNYTSDFKNRIRKINYNDNYLWIATYSGLQCFDIISKQYIAFGDDATNLYKDQIIQDLFIDSKQRLWITYSGSIRCALIVKENHKINLKIVTINNKKGLNTSASSMQKVVELSNGTTLLLSNNKIYEINANQKDARNISTSALNFDKVSQIHAIGNTLWTFSQQKAIALQYNNGTITKVDEVSYPFCNIAYISHSNDYIWASTRQGIMRINKAQGVNRISFHNHTVVDPNSVSSDHQSNIFIDRQSNLWVTTWSSGVSYTNTVKQPFELLKYLPIKSNQYLPSEFVYSIHEDNLGHIYIGTKFGGISRFNVQSKTIDYTVDLNEKLKINPVVPCIISDDDWIYAVITFQGSAIYRINKRNQKIEFIKSYKPNTVFSIGFDMHKQLWAGVLRAGLSCLKIENGRVMNEKLYNIDSDPILNLSSNDVNYIYCDNKKNEILASTANGLNRIMLNQQGEVAQIAYYLSNNKNANTLSSNYIWAIDKENDSTYWIGTLGRGLNRINIGKRVEGTAKYKAEHFGTKEGAPSNDIESVLVDKFGNVWCGGRYLSRCNYKTKKFKTYYEEDGIQSYLFGTGTSCKARNGMLFFGGLKGMNYFMPDTTVDKTDQKIQFSRLIIDGKELGVLDSLNGKIVLEKDLHYTSDIQLPYPCNNLTIEFSSIVFNLKKRIQYRYKLEGFDNDWNYTNGLNPSAMYPKLPYKKYKFIVESSTDNQSYRNGNFIYIDILPPWWLSVWAFLFYFITFSLIIWIAFKYAFKWTELKRQMSLHKESEKQKDELMELKTNFFTNISHEFKTPLTLINAAVIEIESKNESIFSNRYFQILKRNNAKLLHLISELMDFQRSNTSQFELNTTEIEICKFVDEIVEEFYPLSERSTIDLKLELPTKPLKIWVDEECLVKILSNVISNSLRYTESGGLIVVKLTVGDFETYKPHFQNKISFTENMQKGNQLIFSVIDSGVGISNDSLPDIFERFHTVISKTSKHLGSGIGLALVKSLVLLHKGGLLVSSERNSGTEIVFSIPLNSEYLSENQKITDTKFDRQLFFDDYKMKLLDEESSLLYEIDESKPTLLIADDNKEIIMVLFEHFKNEYNVLFAYNGKEALDLCKEKFPDVVVSDILMPIMTGFELCTILKTHIKTCNIPIILLTARTDTEDMIKGLNEGADAYLTKPFNLSLLHSTIINQLNKSKKTKNRVVVDVNRQEDEMKFFVDDPENQKFIDKLINILLSNLDNTNYSVDNLCAEIGMGRSRLYAQIKSITNLTLGEMIRDIRMKKAAELLRTTSLSIGEVAYKVGIDSPSFFTRTFKLFFGMSPSEYIKK